MVKSCTFNFSTQGARPPVQLFEIKARNFQRPFNSSGLFAIFVP